MEEFEDEEKYGNACKRFRFRELQSVTVNFNENGVIGEGSFGKVYKGSISSNHLKNYEMKSTTVPIAIKKLNRDSIQGYREWLAEVLLLNKMRHPNLIKLLGFCLEKGEAILVYEHCKHGSLEKLLFPLDGKAIIPWRRRLEIAYGAAEGLAFLHKNNIIHRDFKSSNILLDENFEVKVTDFGLARYGPQGNKTHISTKVMGTLGYLDPAYMETGRLTLHSDTYAFGVVLLELLTGNRTILDSKLTTWARPHLSGEYPNIDKLIDYRLNGDFVFMEALKLTILAKHCIADNPLERPEMHVVVSHLRKLLERK